MSANPYKRGTTERVRCVPARRQLDAEELNSVLTELWGMAVDSTDEDADSLWLAAARIRHGARLACARLRVRLARAELGWAEEEGAEIEDIIKLCAELDRARRVLAKLEGREP